MQSEDFKNAALAAAIVGATVLFLTINGLSSKSINPFATDTREEDKPFEKDKGERDAVIKNGYSHRKYDASIADGRTYDAIIVGSGIGGLVTAAIMARSGKKVLVLEQHDQAGGCCHSFHEKGFEFDTGIHYIGEMRNNTAFRFLLDQLSNGHLKWSDVCDDFDTVVLVNDDGDGQKGLRDVHQAVASQTKLNARWIPFKSSREETIASLTKAFPQEKVAINKYFELLDANRKCMLEYVKLKAFPRWVGQFLTFTGLMSRFTNYFKYASKSTTDALKEITDNDSLRAVLCYNFGDYGTIPKDAPFSVHASLQNHFLKGVSYPIGGSSEIAFHIIPTITKAGGSVFVRAEVDGIVTNSAGTKALGVRMKKDGTVITAPLIISNAGLYNTVALLSERAKPKLNYMLQHVEHGNGGLSVYVGLKGTAEELGLSGKHYWAIWAKKGEEDLDAITEGYMSRSQAEAATSGPVPLLFISFPSAKDPLWPSKHPNKSTATIVTFANYDWFKQWENGRVMHRGQDYQEFKSQMGELIWKQTLALFPQLKDKVEYFEVGTPVTNRHYLRAQRGEMYGANHSKGRFTESGVVDLRPETGIKNLYLTGQDVFNCGFAGASFGGVFCAAAVLGRDVYTDLTKLKAKSKPSIPRK